MKNQKIIGIILVILLLVVIVLVKSKNGETPVTPVTPENPEISTSTPASTSTSTPPSPKLPAGSTPPIDISLISGTTWVWEKTILSATSSVTPKQPQKFTLVLASDTQVSGTTDCNGFSGIYMVGTDGVLTFGPFAMTKMFCEGSQEGVFVDMLSKVHGYGLTANGKLSLTLENNGGVMTFKKK